MTRAVVRTACCLLAIAGMWAPALPAVAATPQVNVFQIDDTFVSRTSEACGFEILLHLQGTFRAIDYVDRNGDVVRSLMTYPNVTYTFINSATGVSVTSHSPDPEHYTWNADGSLTLRVTGLVMHLGARGEAKVGTAGQILVTISPDGEATESAPVGLHEDYHAALCQILAP